LSGIRRVGKTTFLRQDLIPALEEQGAVVIYVDLWTDVSKSPATLVYDAVKSTMAKFQNPEPGFLKRFKGGSISAAGLSFGFQLDSVGAPGGTPLALAIEELVTAVDADVVLIVDEVQSALQSEDGRALLHALKAGRGQRQGGYAAALPVCGHGLAQVSGDRPCDAPLLALHGCGAGGVSGAG
jgi:hypothetical protein